MEEILTNEELLSAVMVFLMALAGLVVVITKMTPSTEDDVYASKFLRVVHRIAAVFGVKPTEPK